MTRGIALWFSWALKEHPDGSVEHVTPATVEHTGYNRVRRRLIETLRRGGLAVQDGGPPPEEFADVVQIAHAPLFRHLAPSIWKRRADRAIVYTTWESSRLPWDWVEAMNEFDAVWTTSEWNKRTFLESGVRVPIFVIHHGVDPGMFPPMHRPDRDTFTFLWQGMAPGPLHNLTLDEPVIPATPEAGIPLTGRDAAPPWYMACGKHPHSPEADAARAARCAAGDRKQALLVREAFLRLRQTGYFGPDVRLALKWTTVFNKRWEMANWPLDGTHVDLYGCRMTEEDLRALIFNVDCSVNPYRAEGFAMIPLEHMATCLPSIQTAWSGAMDYLQDLEGLYLPLSFRPGTAHAEQQAKAGPYSGKAADPVDREIAKLLEVQDLGEDSDPSLDELMEHMAHAYDHRASVREMGRDAAMVVHRDWSWDRAFGQVLQSLEELGWTDLLWSSKEAEERRSSVIHHNRHALRVA